MIITQRERSSIGIGYVEFEMTLYVTGVYEKHGWSEVQPLRWID